MGTIETLRRYLEHAPKDPGPIAPGLAGWNFPEGQICSTCAGRIIARGCPLPPGSEPIWGTESLVCALHPEAEAE